MVPHFIHRYAVDAERSRDGVIRQPAEIGHDRFPERIGIVGDRYGRFVPMPRAVGDDLEIGAVGHGAVIRRSRFVSISQS